MDRFNFDVFLTFPTIPEAETFKNNFALKHDGDYRESPLDKIVKWPKVSFTNENNSIKVTCALLKELIQALQSYPITNLVKLEYSLGLSVSTDVLKDEYNVLPKGKVHITIHKEFDDMLIIITQLRHLDETVDNIIKVYG